LPTSSVLESAVARLMRTPGIVKCKVLTEDERKLVSELETETSVQNQLLGMKIVNEGIIEVLNREHVVAISHSKELRHPPGPIVVICDEKNIVGEEVWERYRLREAKDSNLIWLGKSMVLYRDAVTRARGKPLTLAYRALPFPELEELDEICDVVSVTIGSLTHVRLSQRVGWDFNDPNLGTVLIAFNERKSLQWD